MGSRVSVNPMEIQSERSIFLSLPLDITLARMSGIDFSQLFRPGVLDQALNHATQLIVAAFLGLLLSFQRTPDRYRLQLIEAHALLAIAGSMFIIIIGDNFVRAVGLLGAASVVRYRYAIPNPRDASTLILALGIGMACGSNALLVATLCTVLILIVSQLLRLFPEALPFHMVSRRDQAVLRLTALDYDAMMARVDPILKRHGIEYSLVSFERKARKSGEGMVTEVNLHLSMGTGIKRHELTHELVDDNIDRVSWHRAK